MLPNEVVDSEVQRDRCLVRLKIFAVAESLALIPLQLLPDRPECTPTASNPRALSCRLSASVPRVRRRTATVHPFRCGRSVDRESFHPCKQRMLLLCRG